MTVLRTHVIGNWLWEEGREDFTSEQPGAKHYVFKMSEKKRKSQLRQEPSDADVAARGQQGLAVAYHICFGMSGYKNEFLKKYKGRDDAHPWMVLCGRRPPRNACQPPSFLLHTEDLPFPAVCWVPDTRVCFCNRQRDLCLVNSTSSSFLWWGSTMTQLILLPGEGEWLLRLTFPFREWRLPLTSSHACTCAFPLYYSCSTGLKPRDLIFISIEWGQVRDQLMLDFSY